jgi:hypothetical protein
MAPRQHQPGHVPRQCFGYACFCSAAYVCLLQTLPQVSSSQSSVLSLQQQALRHGPDPFDSDLQAATWTACGRNELPSRQGKGSLNVDAASGVLNAHKTMKKCKENCALQVQPQRERKSAP